VILPHVQYLRLAACNLDRVSPPAHHDGRARSETREGRFDRPETFGRYEIALTGIFIARGCSILLPCSVEQVTGLFHRIIQQELVERLQPTCDLC
jgi:hypothetical protein